MSEQLSADVKALLDRVAAGLEMLRGKPEGPIGW